MVTLKDIARACGVSRSTVSKAMNGYGDVNRETAERIRQMAETMGYLPNLAARSLKTNRSYSLGIVFSDQLGSGLKHEYFTCVLNSFKEEAEAAGYSITFLSDCPGGRRMSYLEQCRYRSLEGVMVACADYEAEQILEMVKSGLPMVTIDYTFSECTGVLSDNVRGMHDLMHYVFRCGHREIAYIHGELTSVTRKRLASFYQCCEEFGVTPRPEWIIQSRYRDAESCRALTRQLLSGGTRPTCILYPDDCALVGGLNELQERGLRVPEEISIAGYDGSILASLLSPKLTTVRQDTDMIGRIAARKLIAAIEKPRTWLAEQIQVPGELVPGESVARLAPQTENETPIKKEEAT